MSSWAQATAVLEFATMLGAFVLVLVWSVIAAELRMRRREAESLRERAEFNRVLIAKLQSLGRDAASLKEEVVADGHDAHDRH